MGESLAVNEYPEFIRRIRAGDEQAAEEVVRRYEPEIRLEVRSWLRLRNPSLRRVFDSMDVCQSVLASFFARAAVGEFDLDEPSQLIRLLVGMARKKVAEQARFHQRKRRDVRRVGANDPEANRVAGSEATPSRVASGRELLQKLRESLLDDERQIADLRAARLGLGRRGGSARWHSRRPAQATGSRGRPRGTRARPRFVSRMKGASGGGLAAATSPASTSPMRCPGGVPRKLLSPNPRSRSMSLWLARAHPTEPVDNGLNSRLVPDG